MANIRQVAELANVSTATVSRVLNGNTKVSIKTRIKVESAIEKLNYEPNMLGRNLRNAESRLLLVLIPKISNPFYLEIIRGIEATVLGHGYHVLLCGTGSDPKREDIYFDLVKSKMADGIISMDPAVNVEKLMKLAGRHNIVQCSEYAPDSGIPYVTIDNEAAAYEATTHLIKLGHKRIGFINSDDKFLYARQREAGFRRALIESGISVRDDYIYYSKELKFENGQQVMRKMLAHENRPTAVFAVSDLLAVGALKEINAHGLHVPNDIAIIGFDKIDYSKMTEPTLTTVAQPMYNMGVIAAKLLIEKIKGKPVESVILDYELVIRESTLG